MKTEIYNTIRAQFPKGICDTTELAKITQFIENASEEWGQGSGHAYHLRDQGNAAICAALDRAVGHHIALAQAKAGAATQDEAWQHVNAGKELQHLIQAVKATGPGEDIDESLKALLCGTAPEPGFDSAAAMAALEEAISKPTEFEKSLTEPEQAETTEDETTEAEEPTFDSETVLSEAEALINPPKP